MVPEGRRLLRIAVDDAWIDYNGHLSEAYYVLIFGYASDALYDLIGMGDAHRRTSETSVYTVESHIRYLAEVPRGSTVEVATRLLGADARRLHFLHTMFREHDADPAATTELMTLHVDTAAKRVTPFPQPVAAKIRALLQEQTVLPRPEGVGRGIRGLVSDT